MRTCIVGGGLAGALLAWRLTQESGFGQVDVYLGGEHSPDATEASGGIVRSYEPEPDQRDLATASMTELLASPVLRSWADFHRTGSVYVRASGVGLAEAAAGITGATLRTDVELARDGWANLPAGSAAVLEVDAGHISPAKLRQAICADLTSRSGVRLVSAAVERVTPGGDRPATCRVAGDVREYDRVVIAAGAWTPQLLRASGLPTAYRTKSIQYAVYPVGDWRPPTFVDEAIGLYAKPVGPDALLLGLWTDAWDIAPGRHAADPALHAEAIRLAGLRFPRLRLGPARERVSATDCFAAPPVLALGTIGPPEGRLFTFTGGSGGAAKTVLAASSIAAKQLNNRTNTALRGQGEDQP